MMSQDQTDPRNPRQPTDWFSQNAPPDPNAGRTRYNTTPNWLDPFNPPPPSDVYYAEWAAANPGAGGGAPTGTQLSPGDVGTVQWTPPETTTPVTGPTAGRTTGSAPGLPTSGFGAMPATYQSDPNAPTYTPLAPYQPQQWTGGDYQNPTEADLLASPGYQARLDRGLQGKARQFAAQGTILNGGTLKALDRYGQDYATNEYQTLRNNTFEAYKQRYGQFQDAAGMNLGARTINANENLNTFANRTSQYQQGNQRTLSDYLTNLSARRNAENDYWGRLQDLNQTGANLAGNSR